MRTLYEIVTELRSLCSELDQVAGSAVTAPLPPLPISPAPDPPQFVPGPLPTTAPLADLISAVPYRSQWDPDGNQFSSDCGPACVAMVLQYFGTKVDINMLARDAGMVGQRNFTLPADLIRAADLHGLKLSRKYAFNVRMLALEIVERKPVIALIHYGSLASLREDTGYIGGHWVVVVGVDDKNVYIHDPDWKAPRREEGRGLPVPVDVFKAAWACMEPDEKSPGKQKSDGNTPNQCLVVDAK